MWSWIVTVSNQWRYWLLCHSSSRCSLACLSQQRPDHRRPSRRRLFLLQTLMTTDITAHLEFLLLVVESFYDVALIHFYRVSSAKLRSVIGIPVTLVTLWNNFNRTGPTLWCGFLPNRSPNTLAFSNVKILQKFEECHPQRNNFLHVPSFWNSESLGKWMHSLQASCLSILIPSSVMTTRAATPQRLQSPSY